MMKKAAHSNIQSSLKHLEKGVTTLLSNDKKISTRLDTLEKNVGALVENDKFLLKQFEKLYDEFEALRNDVYDIKGKTTSMSLRLFDVESKLATVKRVVDEEPQKRRELEVRVTHLEKAGK